MQQQNLQKDPKQNDALEEGFIDQLKELQIKEQTHNLFHLKNIKRNIEKPENDKIKIDVSKTQYPLIKLVAFNLAGWKIWSKQSSKQEVNVFWNDTYVTQQLIRKLKPYQKINHFPSSHELGKKNYLTQNIKKLKKIIPQQYKFYPETFNLPQQYSKFKQFQEKNQQKWYIVKPTANSQGRGIYITQKIANTKDELIVQEYISKPLIIQNCKFDLRIYVMIKSFTPLKIFIFNQGLARFATQTYEQPNQANQNNFKMHLTNYAINKLNPAYIFNKDQKEDYIGHKRSISSIMQTLQKLGCDVRSLQIKIDTIIVKTILSAHIKIADSYKACRCIEDQPLSLCFQILGFDVLIDQLFQPYLLQVNHTPSFCTDTPLDSVIKRCLIMDTLNLINVDPSQKQSYFKFKQNEFQQQVQSKQRKNFLNRQKLVYQETFQNQNLGGFRKIYPIIINPQQYFNGLFYLKKENTLNHLQKIEEQLWQLYERYNKIITKMVDKGKKRPLQISIQQKIQNVVSAFTTDKIKIQKNRTNYLQRQQQKKRKITQSYYMFMNKNYQNRKSLQVKIHQLEENEQLQKIYKIDKSHLENSSQVCLKNREVVAIKKHIQNFPKKETSPVKLRNIKIDFHQQINPKGKHPLSYRSVKNQVKQQQNQRKNVILFSPPHIRHHQVLKLRGTNKAKFTPLYLASENQKPSTCVQIASRINKIIIPTIKLQKLKYSEKSRSMDSEVRHRYKEASYINYYKPKVKKQIIDHQLFEENIFSIPKINEENQQFSKQFQKKKIYQNEKSLQSAGFYTRRTANTIKKAEILNNSSFNFNDGLSFKF